MRKLAIVFALVGIMIGFANTASAQDVRVRVGRDGFGISVGSHRGNGHWDGGYRHGGRRNNGHWGGDYRRYPRDRAYDYPSYRNNRYYYQNRSYNYAPQTISVLVWEYRQVRTRYGWEDRQVQVRVIAYWDSYFNAYVYRDSYGRQHVID
jgi:hypothetical protein